MIELKCRKNSSLKVQVRSVPLMKQKWKIKETKTTKQKFPPLKKTQTNQNTTKTNKIKKTKTKTSKGK